MFEIEKDHINIFFIIIIKFNHMKLSRNHKLKNKNKNKNLYLQQK